MIVWLGEPPPGHRSQSLYAANPVFGSAHWLEPEVSGGPVKLPSPKTVRNSPELVESVPMPPKGVGCDGSSRWYKDSVNPKSLSSCPASFGLLWRLVKVIVSTLPVVDTSALAETGSPALSTE